MDCRTLTVDTNWPGRSGKQVVLHASDAVCVGCKIIFSSVKRRSSITFVGHCLVNVGRIHERGIVKNKIVAERRR